MSLVQIEPLLWPPDQLDLALEQLARRGGLVDSRAHTLPTPPTERRRLTAEQSGRWLEQVAAHLGIEVEPVQCSYAEVDRLLGRGGPLILRLPDTAPKAASQPIPQTELRLLAVQRRSATWVEILTPDRTLRRLPTQQIRNALCVALETPHQAGLDRLLQVAKIPDVRQSQVRRALLNQQIGTTSLQCGWLLRLPPNQGIVQQVRSLHLVSPFVVLLVSMIAQQGLLLLAWWMIGGSALQGQLGRQANWGWLWAWALLLISTLFFQWTGSLAQQTLSTRSAAFFKQRLLYGVLRLDPQEIRHQGMGQFLYSMMQAEAVEMFSLSGGFGLLLTLVQLSAAIFVLNLGLGGWRLPALLLLWIALVTLGSWLYLRRTLAWDASYQAMTNDQVERMMGHRTRLAQEDVTHWHDAEDSSLDHYIRTSVAMDRVKLMLQPFAVRGWQVIGLATIFTMLLCGQGGCVAFVQNLPGSQPLFRLLEGGVSGVTQVNALALLLSLSGLLLAQQALSGFLNGLSSLIGLLVAWRQVQPIFHAANRTEAAPAVSLLSANASAEPTLNPTPNPTPNHPPFLIAQQLDFRYRSEGKLSVQGATLQIYPLDRLLLEGVSGGGKSSLAALLAGLRQPNNGLLLLHGFDRQTIGSAEWRQRVVTSPQFHENHIFSESLAFNLLMGRRWPAQAEDLQAAEVLCHELGLGELIRQMPAGLQQMVGESGWRLSHGERSRIFLARALLQESDLLVLDETFAALDPESLRTSLECVLRRAPALLVIAHP